MNEAQLLQLKKKVDEAKQKTSELTGQKNALMKQFKDEWKCSSVEEAEKKAKTMTKEIESLELQIEKGIEELETKYNIE